LHFCLWRNHHHSSGSEFAWVSTRSTGQSWSCGSGAGGAHSSDLRAGTPLLRELGLVSLGKRSLQGDLRAAASTRRRLARELERRL